MNKIAKNKIAKMGTMVLILLLMTIILIPQISAKPQYLTALQSKYGDGSCTDCHTDPNGGKSLTDYGTNFKSQPNYKNDPVAAVVAIGPPGGSASNTTASPTVIETVVEKDTAISPTESVTEQKESVTEQKESVTEPKETVAESKETNEKEEKEEEENEKEETMVSPGFDIVITIGIILTIYIFRNKIRKN